MKGWGGDEGMGSDEEGEVMKRGGGDGESGR